MHCGLRDSDLICITNSVLQVEEIDECILFGSRAKRTYKLGSDVDLAIKGDRITFRTVSDLFDWLNEESPMPYFFDVVQYETISNPSLIEHIDRVGISLFIRSSTEKKVSNSAFSAVKQTQ